MHLIYTLDMKNCWQWDEWRPSSLLKEQIWTENNSSYLLKIGDSMSVFLCVFYCLHNSHEERNSSSQVLRSFTIICLLPIWYVVFLTVSNIFVKVFMLERYFRLSERYVRNILFLSLHELCVVRHDTVLVDSFEDYINLYIMFGKFDLHFCSRRYF